MAKEISGENSVSVSVVLSDGSIQYSTDKALVRTTLPEQVRRAYENSGKKSACVRYRNTCITALPVPGQDAAIVIVYDEKQVNGLHESVFNKNLRTVGIIIACGIIFLTLSDFIILGTAYSGKFPKRRISVVIFIIVVLSQIVFSGLNINDFRNWCLKTGTEKMLSDNLKEIIPDFLTVLVISLFFFAEMMVLLSQFVERQSENAQQDMQAGCEAIRPAVFLLLFGVDISLSFLPLYIEKLYEPMAGLSKDMIMGFPTSVRMLTTAIFFFISGAWFDRRGWHEPFFTGLFLAGTGLLCSALAPDALHLIVSQGILGMGYGLSLMSAQGFVVLYTDRTKAQGIARLGAGTLAGHICGTAAGAILAEQIGYRSVFFAGAVIVFLAVIYTAFSMHSMIDIAKQGLRNENIVRVRKQPLRVIGTGWFLCFLLNRNVLALLLFSIIPAYIAMIGFLDYFCPVYLSRMGVSQSAIGRVFMINGFCLIYIAPIISRCIDRSGDKKVYIVIGGILGSLAFITFCFTGGLAGAVAAVLLLGLSNSFSIAAQTAYAVELRVSRELGEGKALGILRSLGRSGQVLGPVMFSWLIATAEISKGMMYFGFAYLFITLLFVLVSKRENSVGARRRRAPTRCHAAGVPLPVRNTKPHER